MKLLRRFVPFILVTGLALGVPQLRAQEHPEHAQTQPEGHAPEGQEPAGHEGQGHEAKGEGHGAHHAAIKLFGVDMGKAGQWGIQVFNFVLFAGLLFFLLKGALSSAFKARAKELEDKLSQAERDRAEADAQIRELETRMAGLQEELAGIMAKAATEAEGEKARIIASAQTEAAQIRAQTLAEIDFQKRTAEAELRTLVAELAVEGATRRLQNQVTGEVAARVIDRSIEQVGGSK
jgi:F-type H+-transporting ATPase subunit b